MSLNDNMNHVFKDLDIARSTSKLFMAPTLTWIKNSDNFRVSLKQKRPENVVKNRNVELINLFNFFSVLQIA